MYYVVMEITTNPEANMTTTKLRWTREPDGYRSGPFFCQRHHVDDRDFDGGYVHTYWNLVIDGDPYQQHTDLASAKRDAERLAAGREAKAAN